MINEKQFTELYTDITKKATKIPQENYLGEGNYPIVDQGKGQIAGRWNEVEGLCIEIPAIIFGDHTRAIKYIDEPFFIGADGVKVLRPTNKADNPKYYYYALQAARIPNLGYSRHFKVVKELMIRVYSRADQDKIVSILEKIDEVIEIRQAELSALEQLVKSRFIEMFGDITKEDTLINLCHFIDYRGKTPEKAESGLPFITAKNVKMHHMSFDTQEYISKETYDKVMTRGFPKIGDVVFTTEAPLGNVCRIPHIDTEFYIGQRIITMQTDCLEPAYLEYALSSDKFREKIAEKSSGSTVTGIRSKLLEQLTIPVPPRKLQMQFATFVEQVDKSKYHGETTCEMEVAA